MRKLSSARRWQLTGGALLIALVVVVIDQGTKVWAEDVAIVITIIEIAFACRTPPGSASDA